nr:hypothetical protein [Acidobacteriota bacterium]
MKVEEIARLLSGKLRAGGETEIYRATGIGTAAENEISFVEKAELAAQAQNTKASCLIVPEN